MARQHYFYNVMRKTIIQFLDLFNDIVIARYNPDTGAVIKYVKVPLKFAPKTKQWYWQELRENQDRRDAIFPMMAVSLDTVEYANDRQVNRNHPIYFQYTSEEGGEPRTSMKYHYNPVPYDFTFKLQIAAEYMVDITQVVEQIFPFFTPETYIRLVIPELCIDGKSYEDTGIGTGKLDLRVLYESGQREAVVELDEANYRVLTWTMTFKVQGYLFSPVGTRKSALKTVIQLSVDEDGEPISSRVLVPYYETPADDEPFDEDAKRMYEYEDYTEPTTP